MSNYKMLKDVDFNMEKLISIFHNMKNEYHNPTNFIANADALIQALRNFTFFLQSKKNDIPNFDNWYTPWQEMMRANPYMRFIVDMRNSIVKQGINTAKSHALIVLYTDYSQTLSERRMDIYSTTDEIKKEIMELAKKQPVLKHASGDIHRSYIFNYTKKDDLEVLDTLFYCTFFIRKVHEDFKNFIKTGVIQKELPKITAPWVDMSDFTITFQVNSGHNVSQKVIPVKRDRKVIEEYKKRFGDIKLKHDINSDNPHEQVQANLELAKQNRVHFKELLPVLKYYSVKKGAWGAIFPIVTSRADKILFWENFSNQVARDEIDKFYLTVDAWRYDDIDKGMATIRSGKEISSLSNLKETLLAYYLDKSGKIIAARSPYSLSKSGKIKFGKVNIQDDKPSNHPMFTAVFNVWGVRIENNKK